MSINQPIQLPVESYSSLDANAPQLTNTGETGEIKSILKAVLSTGYGIKPAATGWQMLFEDADKAVFRSIDPRSTGFCVRIDNNATKGGQVTCYESMTDVDTGVAQWSDSSAGFVHNATNVTSVTWRMYVTPVSFVLMTNAQIFGNNYPVGFWFGDMLSTKESDNGNCCVMHPVKTGQGATQTHGGFLTNSYSKKAIAKNHNSTSTGIEPRIYGGFLNLTTTDIYPGHNGYPVYICESNNAVRLLPPWTVSNKKESINASEQVINGRSYLVTNNGFSAEYVYFIPVDYWLI
ncbi:MAG: hypothetical protein CR977_00805 [Gammaproteobacteria bacterium]|nr:MAG: hypothetical protein CR977_00805 [Gammaproteobacteria bacterium]